MAVDLAALRTELQNDPTALGYAAHVASGSDVDLAALLNAARSGITVFRGLIQSYEIINATDPTEWSALGSAEKQRYQTLTGAGRVDTANANVRAAFLAMFANGTATRAALVALASRTASRAEQLFGADTTISTDLIACALRGGS